jgi:hypothetical protein
MKIALDIEEEDIERIVRSLDNQHAYTRSRNFEDSGYKRASGSVSRIPEARAGASGEPFQGPAGAPPARTLICLAHRGT